LFINLKQPFNVCDFVCNKVIIQRSALDGLSSNMDSIVCLSVVECCSSCRGVNICILYNKIINVTKSVWFSANFHMFETIIEVGWHHDKIK
jgi:hypothetical protein